MRDISAPSLMNVKHSTDPYRNVRQCGSVVFNPLQDHGFVVLSPTQGLDEVFGKNTLRSESGLAITSERILVGGRRGRG